MDKSKQQLIAGKHIIGIDPAKVKHQAVLIDPSGLQIGKSFAFDVAYEEYTKTIWKKVTLLLPKCNPDNTLFAIKTSCPEGMDNHNLWMTLAFYLKTEGYATLMVSPLTTHLSRPMAKHDFSPALIQKTLYLLLQMHNKETAICIKNIQHHPKKLLPLIKTRRSMH